MDAVPSDKLFKMLDAIIHVERMKAGLGEAPRQEAAADAEQGDEQFMEQLLRVIPVKTNG